MYCTAASQILNTCLSWSNTLEQKANPSPEVLARNSFPMDYVEDDAETHGSETQKNQIAEIPAAAGADNRHSCSDKQSLDEEGCGK